MNLKRRKVKEINTTELRDRQLITDFGWMVLAIFIGVILPGGIMWVLFGYDFDFSIEVLIAGSGTLFKLISSFIVFLFAAVSAWTFYYFKICKADIFLFSFAFFSIYISFFFTGKFLSGTGGKEIIFRFLISLASGAVGTLIGTMLSWYIVNLEYKAEDHLESIEKKREVDPNSLTKKEIKLIKQKEMLDYKYQLKQEQNQKILDILNSKVQNKLKEEEILKEKLNKEEEAKRLKEKSKKK
ncbi:hypothetical protein STIUS_v1c03280 [Spiroplasma sp. TIUS-1]|uniref:DxFTY motif-containing membrane protein n=1 Tax=Spiroplasma sp. TIUS-1 TaxID=216963 RepID=UPI001397035B|nr:hypothetical protein [Spiroplasma sp. TIUS-1]QHX35882.1 hypothetical protein STIUS_v1c03280 [Spiroplasma sp. TIUS-1]